MFPKRDVEKLEVIVYQRDVQDWHAIAFDVTGGARVWLGEAHRPNRDEAEQYAKDLEDFYLCDLEITDRREA